MAPLTELAKPVLAPRLDQVTPAALFGIRGPAAEELGRVPKAVVHGFEQSLGSRTSEELHDRLSLVEPSLRGFAYEGATMGCAVLDASSAGPGRRARAVMTGPGAPYLFLNYIGLGFALARLPRRAWARVQPDLPTDKYHPVMSWLVIDGYGFDRAYFNADKYIGRQRQDKAVDWNGQGAGYFHRAADQGIGRVLWFKAGGETAAVRRSIEAFAPDRRADLWSGIGLAATFAGQSDGLGRLVEASGGYWADLAIGTAFAAKGRHAAGWVPSWTEEAVREATGLTTESLVQLVDGIQVGGQGAGMESGYEFWRVEIARRLGFAYGSTLGDVEAS